MKLAGLVIQDLLGTQVHLELMDLKGLRVMLDHEAQLELKVSVDQMENLLVTIVTVTLQCGLCLCRGQLEHQVHKDWMEHQERRLKIT